MDWSTDEVRAQDSIHLSVESVLNAVTLGSKLSTHDLWATFQIQIIAGCLLLFRCSVFVDCFKSQIMILFQCKTYHIWLESGSSGGCSYCWKAFLITQIQSSSMVHSEHSCLSFYISIWERYLPTVFKTDHPKKKHFSSSKYVWNIPGNYGGYGGKTLAHSRTHVTKRIQ